MTVGFTLAVATDGQIGVFRQRSQQIYIATPVGFLHFGQEMPFEFAPSGLLGPSGCFKEFLARRKVWKLHIVDIITCIVFLFHTPGRT